MKSEFCCHREEEFIIPTTAFVVEFYRIQAGADQGGLWVLAPSCPFNGGPAPPEAFRKKK